MENYIDIITGFLESGKTTFINEILNNKEVQECNKIVLLICEEGFTEYDQEELEDLNVTVILLENESELKDHLFQEIAKKYHPDHIIVEYNGTWDISKIIGLIIPYHYKLRNIIFISDAQNFNHQLSNMVTLMQPHILNSDVVVFNRFENLSERGQKKLINSVKNINSRIKVTYDRGFSENKVLKEHFMILENQDNLLFDLKMNMKVSALIILCFVFFILFRIPSAYTYAQSIITVFLSILMQAVPFILLGAFISAGIQIFASTGWIMEKISKGKWYSFLIAAFAGFFMPTCDCGMVPIISGLLKRNTPLPQTITFWLSSSAVSPIVIFSMLYAFPEKPYLALIRLVTGLLIGIMTGLILKVISLETSDVVRKNQRVQRIGKDVLELKYDGVKGKMEAVFAGAKVEFFRVAEYVIVGALVSAVLQTIMPQTMKNLIGYNIGIQFIIMIVAAIFMSTCSTSNAFIGRSFLNDFSIVPILSFIVMGPMLDLKNMIMLSEIIKKKVLLFLAVLIIIESAIIFGILSFFL